MSNLGGYQTLVEAAKRAGGVGPYMMKVKGKYAAGGLLVGVALQPLCKLGKREITRLSARLRDGADSRKANERGSDEQGQNNRHASGAKSKSQDTPAAPIS